MTNLTSMIDAYAALKTQLADLEKQKKTFEETFAELKPGAYESDNWRLTISDSVQDKPDQELDAAQKAAAAKAVEAYRATLSRQYLVAHTVTKTIRTHRVGVPNGKNVVG